MLPSCFHDSLLPSSAPSPSSSLLPSSSCCPLLPVASLGALPRPPLAQLASDPVRWHLARRPMPACHGCSAPLLCCLSACHLRHSRLCAKQQHLPGEIQGSERAPCSCGVSFSSDAEAFSRPKANPSLVSCVLKRSFYQRCALGLGANQFAACSWAPAINCACRWTRTSSESSEPVSIVVCFWQCSSTSTSSSEQFTTSSDHTTHSTCLKSLATWPHHSPRGDLGPSLLPHHAPSCQGQVWQRRAVCRRRDRASCGCMHM